MAQWLTNPTNIHEDEGLIPGLAQCCPCSVLPWAVVQVTGVAWIPHCVAVVQASSWSSDWTPSPGSSVCLGYSPKNTKDKEKEKKKKM